ncbi:MAG: DNA primase [Bacilli bacterium]|nr:DNA primase [Bacilli bacterium]
MAYDRDLIDALLKSADIVNVISSYIPVVNKGRQVLAVCPFHADTNPSLSISKEKQIFNCFVCHTGGNAIGFIQKYKKISYGQAVRELAELVGFHDPRLQSQAYHRPINKDLQPLYNCINDLEVYYKYSLSIDESEKAREYLAKRHIDEEQIATYDIGYAPEDGRRTVEFLRSKGHSLITIESIGIALAKASGTNDSNAGRIMFPIHDPDGQVVGFSARRIKDDGSPKYVNSPETKIYIKSNLLYNYHRAKDTAHHDGYLYVLEGFMDVMALGKAGINSAVALMGTALTDHHIELLRRLHCEIRLSLDGDNAGQNGMMNAISKFAKAKIPCRLVSNPKDLRDPDDILQEEGPEKLREMMNNLVDPFDFQINFYENVKRIDDPEEKREVTEDLLRYLKDVPEGIDRENGAVKLARISGYEVAAIREMLNRYSDPTYKEKAPVKEVETRVASPNSGKRIALRSKTSGQRRTIAAAEKRLLIYMLHEPSAVQFYCTHFAMFQTPEYAVVADIIADNYDANKTIPSLSEIASVLSALSEDGGTNYEGIFPGVVQLYDEFSSTPAPSEEKYLNCYKTIEQCKRVIAEREAAMQVVKTGIQDENGGDIVKEYVANKARVGNKKKPDDTNKN